MHNASLGGWLAAACSIVFAVGANAQAAAQGDIFESGYMGPTVYPNHPPTTYLFMYGAGSGIDRTTMNFANFKNGVEGDIFAAGSRSWKDVIAPTAPQIVLADAFSCGTDGDTVSPAEIALTYNNDPEDPFYYPIPSVEARTDIFDYSTIAMYRPTTWSMAPSLQGATNGTAPSLQGATNGTIEPSLQGFTNGTIGPHGRDAFSVRGANTMAHSGWKYNPSQPRWEPSRLPIKVYISGYVEAARGGLVRDAIKSALHEWSQASNGAIRYQITNRYCDADVHFVDGLTDDHEFAQTCVDYHKGPIDHAKVIFLISTLTKLPEARVRGLCLHEIGHVFGILKHSKNNRDAMSEMAIDEVHPITVLSEKDKRVMASLYQRWDDSNKVTLRVASAISSRSLRAK